MNLGLTREQILELLQGSDLSPAAAEKIAAAMDKNNKTIEGNLDRYIHNIFISRMRFRGPHNP